MMLDALAVVVINGRQCSIIPYLLALAKGIFCPSNHKKDH